MRDCDTCYFYDLDNCHSRWSKYAWKCYAPMNTLVIEDEQIYENKQR